MTSPQHQAQVPTRRWAVWLCWLLLIPLGGASGALVYFGLVQSIVTGRLVTTSRGWTGSSRVITFAESPVAFVISYGLTALLAACIVAVTVVIARLAISRTWPRR